MSGLLHQVFLALTPARVTDYFLVLMLSIFALALMLRFTGRGREFVEQGPGFLTSLGILGTFIGIIIGLYEFSLEEIDRSIADLMAGLKTAFITSVIGLALSLLLRVFTRMIRLPSDPVEDTASIDDLNRNLIELRDSFDGFSRGVSAELVAGLERVVSEFNQRLQVQFGDNLQAFCSRLAELGPALDSAAQAYRDHAQQVETWGQRAEESQRTLAEQQGMLRQMYDRIAALPQLYRGLDELLERQGQQAQQLTQLLQSQADSAQQLTELVPQLPQNMERLSQGLVAAQEGVDENLAALNRLLQGQTESLAQGFGDFSAALENLQALDPRTMEQLVSASAETHRESMRELAQMLATTHREMLQALTEVIRRELKDTDVSIRRQYEQIDRLMATQVEQVLAAMGEALATVGGSFTRDYQQLLAQVKRLRERTAEYAE